MRTRSAACSAAIASFPPVAIVRRSSSAASTPVAIVSPSPYASGGRATSVRWISAASSAASSHAAARAVSAPPQSVRRSAAITCGSRVSESPSARTSRGVARPAVVRPARRSISRTPSSASRSAARASASVWSDVTASSRERIAGSCVSGARIHWRNSRAPIGVCVRSSTPISVPLVSLLARSDSTSSRFRRVISSSGIVPPGRSMLGRARCGSPPGCSSRR